MMCWIRLFWSDLLAGSGESASLGGLSHGLTGAWSKKLPDFSFGIGFVVDGVAGGVAGDVADGGVDYDDAGADSHLVQS